MALVACPDDNDDGGGGPTAVMSFIASTTPSTSPVSIAEDGGVATVTLTLDQAIPMGDSALVFPYGITGTGISANDITADSLTGSITVAAGSATGTLTITAVDNSAEEGDKTMTITLGALPSAITATGIDPVEITIIDDEAPPASVRSFVASTTPPTTPVSIAENGGVATITLTLDRAIPMGDSALTFPYTITGTGILASDITADSLTGSITVPVGSAIRTLTITAVDDSMTEGDKTMTITLGALPSGITASSSNRSTQITIIDDEAPPASVRSFVASTTPPTTPVSIAENGGVATLTLTLDRAIQTGDSALVFSLEEITGIQAEDIDGSLSGRSITVDPGSATGTLTITAVDDSVTESDKTMTITLDALPSGITASGIDPVEIIITDDDLSVSSFRVTPNPLTLPVAATVLVANRRILTLTLILNRNAVRDLMFPLTITPSPANALVCVVGEFDISCIENFIDTHESAIAIPTVPMGSDRISIDYTVAAIEVPLRSIPTAYTFTITLPSGIADGGDDLSERVVLITTPAGDVGDAGLNR